jgi:hypothetical protein
VNAMGMRALLSLLSEREPISVKAIGRQKRHAGSSRKVDPGNNIEY